MRRRCYALLLSTRDVHGQKNSGPTLPGQPDPARFGPHENVFTVHSHEVLHNGENV